MQKLSVTPVALQGNDSLRCFDVSAHYVATGSELGDVLLYDRRSMGVIGRISSDAALPSGLRGGLAVSVAHASLSPDEAYLGLVYAAAAGHIPVIVEVSSLTAKLHHTRHGTFVTAIAWSPCSGNFYTADNGGQVFAICTAPPHMGVFSVISEECSVVQLHCSPATTEGAPTPDPGAEPIPALLVASTLRRSVTLRVSVPPEEGLAPTPIGRQPREGIHGACCAHSLVYASRPRKDFDTRLWKAGPLTGSVQKTLMFRHTPDADSDTLMLTGASASINGVYEKVGDHEGRPKYKRSDGGGTLFSTGGVWAATDAQKQKLFLKSEEHGGVKGVTEMAQWQELGNDEVWRKASITLQDEAYYHALSLGLAGRSDMSVHKISPVPFLMPLESEGAPLLAAWGEDAILILNTQSVEVVAIRYLKGLMRVVASTVGASPVLYAMHSADSTAGRMADPTRQTYLSLLWLSAPADRNPLPPVLPPTAITPPLDAPASASASASPTAAVPAAAVPVEEPVVEAVAEDDVAAVAPPPPQVLQEPQVVEEVAEADGPVVLELSSAKDKGEGGGESRGGKKRVKKTVVRRKQKEDGGADGAKGRGKKEKERGPKPAASVEDLLRDAPALFTPGGVSQAPPVAPEQNGGGAAGVPPPSSSQDSVSEGGMASPSRLEGSVVFSNGSTEGAARQDTAQEAEAAVGAAEAPQGEQQQQQEAEAEAEVEAEAGQGEAQQHRHQDPSSEGEAVAAAAAAAATAAAAAAAGDAAAAAAADAAAAAAAAPEAEPSEEAGAEEAEQQQDQQQGQEKEQREVEAAAPIPDAGSAEAGREAPLSASGSSHASGGSAGPALQPAAAAAAAAAVSPTPPPLEPVKQPHDELEVDEDIDGCVLIAPPVMGERDLKRFADATDKAHVAIRDYELQLSFGAAVTDLTPQLAAFSAVSEWVELLLAVLDTNLLLEGAGAGGADSSSPLNSQTSRSSLREKVASLLGMYFRLRCNPVVVLRHAEAFPGRDTLASGGENVVVHLLHFMSKRSLLKDMRSSLNELTMQCAAVGSETGNFIALTYLLQCILPEPRLPLPRGYLVHPASCPYSENVAHMWQPLSQEDVAVLGSRPLGIDSLIMRRDIAAIHEVESQGPLTVACLIYYLPYLFACGLDCAMKAQKMAVKSYPALDWSVVRAAASRTVQEGAHELVGVVWRGKHEYSELYLDYCRYLAEEHRDVCRRAGFMDQYITVLVHTITRCEVPKAPSPKEALNRTVVGRAPARDVMAQQKYRKRLEGLLGQILKDTATYYYTPDEVRQTCIKKSYFDGLLMLGEQQPQLMPVCLMQLLQNSQIELLHQHFEKVKESEKDWVLLIRSGASLQQEERLRMSGSLADVQQRETGPLDRVSYLMCVCLGAVQTMELLRKHLGSEVEYEDFYKKLQKLVTPANTR